MKQKIKNIFRRNDNWVNPLTKLGSSSSRTNNTIFRQNTRLDKRTLTEMYRTDGIAKRIINIVVDDSLRGFINADSELLKELKRINAKQSMFDAASFGRLYGGALIVALIDDGLGLEQPLNHKKINKLVSLRVFDKHQISWDIEDLCTDFYQEYYGEPEIFTITKKQDNLRGNEDVFFRVHRSRCFIFGGERLCTSSKTNNQGWDDSVLQAATAKVENNNLFLKTASSNLKPCF